VASGAAPCEVCARALGARRLPRGPPPLRHGEVERHVGERGGGSTALGVGRSSSVMLPLPHGEGEAGKLRGAGSASGAAEVG
jgi:hypothetical protein